MNNFTKKLKIFFSDKTLVKKVLFVVFALFIFRFLASVPIPGIDASKLQALLNRGGLLSVLNIFSGGGLSSLSIVMLGVGPAITASIIMQVLTMIWPRLKALLHEEGEIGRNKFAQYSRLLSIPLALIQGLALITVLERQGIFGTLSITTKLVDLIIIVTGTVIVMWIGELINEFGIGNGISMIIFAGIVAAFPTHLANLFQAYDPSQIPTYILFGVIGILLIAAVVYITEAERPIPVTYARRSGTGAFSSVPTYIPLKINQAGVIPIIFALSMLLFPQIIGQLLQNYTGIWAKISTALLAFNQSNIFYIILYFVLVCLFTYFYTAVTFDPKSMADNLQKNGAFVSGIRPGKSTEIFVSDILTKITLVGALFLGIVAVMPLIAQKFTHVTQVALGGTSVLIVVAVVIDFIKRINAQISMREY